MEGEQGTIVRIADGKAIIQLHSSNGCQTCGAKHACGFIGGSDFRQMEIPLTADRDGFKVGDQITLSFQPQTRVFSAFLVFLLPVVLLITGYFLGMKLFATEGRAIVSAFVGLIISFFFLWGLNKIFVRHKNFLPTLEKSAFLDRHENGT